MRSPKLLVAVLARTAAIPVTEQLPMRVPCPGTDEGCIAAGIHDADAHHGQRPSIPGMKLGSEVWDSALLERIEL